MSNSIPKLSLIISVYKNIAYLEMVLLSVERQTFKDIEVIIAEDNDGEEMKSFVAEQQKRFPFPIFHISQEKKGFRKNRILNEAVKIAQAKYLQFIDGDSVLQKDYLKTFYHHAEAGYLLFGRRVELDEPTTQQFIKTKNFGLLNLVKLAFTKAKHVKHGLYMPWLRYFQKPQNGFWGCSMGLMKEDLLKINGYDEDYERIGVGEDIDLDWRRTASGIKLKSLKYRAFQYHLYHHRLNRDEDIAFNFKLLDRKKAEGNFFCKNGIVKT